MGQLFALHGFAVLAFELGVLGVSWRLRIANELFDATTATTEDLPAGIPVSKGQHLISRRIVWLAVFAFGIFGTAMFAEPAVTEVEKVIGLSQGSGGAESLRWCRPGVRPAPDNVIAYAFLVSHQVPE